MLTVPGIPVVIFVKPFIWQNTIFSLHLNFTILECGNFTAFCFGIFPVFVVHTF